MNTRIVRLLGMVVCLTIGGSASALGSDRCMQAVNRITAVYVQENLPVAKLLVDFAIADCDQLGCSAGQREQLLALRRQIYAPYMIDQITRARNMVVTQHDGLGALRVLQRVHQMADTIETQLYGLDELYGATFYSAAAQNMAMAKLAEDEEEFERASALRMQALDFMRWAVAFDQRIKVLVLRQISR